jgi:hypothetical protein
VLTLLWCGGRGSCGTGRVDGGELCASLGARAVSTLGRRHFSKPPSQPHTHWMPLAMRSWLDGAPAFTAVWAPERDSSPHC